MTVNFNKDVRLGGLARVGTDRPESAGESDLTSPATAGRTGFFRRDWVDGVIVPSHALKKQVMRHGYLRDEIVHVIHNGTKDKIFVRPDAASDRS